MARESRVVIEDEEIPKQVGSKSINDPNKSPIQVLDDNEKSTDGTSVVRSLSNVVRWISSSMLGSGERAQYEKLLELLQRSTMFRLCSEKKREKIAAHMTLMKFKKGDILMVQGQKQTEAFVIVEGTVVRKRYVDDQIHTVGALGYAGSSDSIGMLHLLEEEPTYSTVQALSDGTAFVLKSEVFKEMLEEDHKLANEVIHSLVVELRKQTYLERTPLFLQTGKEVSGDPLNWFAVSVAASIESFYRSGLNAILIRQLTGNKDAKWFPNMHIQLPSRILYINGFKGLRYLLEHNYDPRQYQYPNVTGLTIALIPGIIMTPISSILEACNVTHMNNEALYKRWTRGLVPRTLREVIFGVGINQLSDFCEERFDSVFKDSSILRNFAGSLSAGAIAGYLSHIPHNLSTLKLVKPSVSYADHFRSLKQPWTVWYRNNFNSKGGIMESIAVTGLTVGLPKGCLVRTAQISGSFIIINSTINALKHINVNVTVDKTPGVI